MRIVNASNFQFAKLGAAYWNQDQKIHHGLIELGHYVYAFSTSDMARQLGHGFRDWGKGKANKALIECCRAVEPDLLLLGHAQMITRETIQQISAEHPHLRVALWYCDPLWVEGPTQHLRDRADLFDALFCTSAGEHLAAISRGRCRSAFIPNAVHRDIERLRTHEQETHTHDFIFIGSDRKDPTRRQLLEAMRDTFVDSSVSFETFGCLDQPPVFGREKDELMLTSRSALNLSRSQQSPLYSSCRIAEMMGNGLLTCTPRGAGLEELYGEDGMLFYDTLDELRERLEDLLKDESWRSIARNGHDRSHELYNARTVAEFIVDFTFERESWQSASWAAHSFTK